jgi:hypothetical protein
LISPALSSYYLDLTGEKYRARILGVKESSASLGGVLGPLLLVGVSAMMTPHGIFIFAGAVMLTAAGLAIVALPAPAQIDPKSKDMNWEFSEKRALAAQSALRGVVLRSSASRKTKIAT